jgi:hypothetical protein
MRSADARQRSDAARGERRQMVESLSAGVIGSRYGAARRVVDDAPRSQQCMCVSLAARQRLSAVSAASSRKRMTAAA